MHEHEEIIGFNDKLPKIANTSYSLSKKISEEVSVRNILRSLSCRFLIKVAAIEEH